MAAWEVPWADLGIDPSGVYRVSAMPPELAPRVSAGEALGLVVGSAIDGSCNYVWGCDFPGGYPGGRAHFGVPPANPLDHDCGFRSIVAGETPCLETGAP